MSICDFKHTNASLRVIFLWMLACLTTCPVVAKANEGGGRPNVVVFLVDDMGLMDTSVLFLTDATGNPKVYPLNNVYRTPNMQRLASQGIRFNNFYAMSVCSPTRVSIMTGQNAARHHTTQWIAPEANNRGRHGPPDWNWAGLDSDDFTLPRLLRENGYRTIHAGKGHFAPFQHDGADPSNLGFDVNIAGRAIGAPGSYFGKDNYDRLPCKANQNDAGNAKQSKGKDRRVPGLEKYHGTDTHLTDALTLEAMSHVRQAVQSEQPFFLYLAHYAVHSPHQSDARFAANYTDTDLPERGRAFATLIEGMDKSLGDVIDGLRSLGVAENTIILFMGDNGSDAPLGHQHAVACAAPLRGKKGSHYEGGVRVPFIAAWAKRNEAHPLQKRLPIPAGEIQPAIANVCDLLPTIGELTGIPLPESHIIDGEALNVLLTGQEDKDRYGIFMMHFPHEHRSSYYSSLRAGDYKLIYHYFPGTDSGGKRYQLFNLATDPFEQDDLSEREPKTVFMMLARLRDELDDAGAQLPVMDGQPMSIEFNMTP